MEKRKMKKKTTVMEFKTLARQKRVSRRFEITSDKLEKLFGETPENKLTAITYSHIGENRIVIKLNRYFIRPKETKKMWLAYSMRLHSYNIDPYKNESILEFKRSI